MPGSNYQGFVVGAGAGMGTSFLEESSSALIDMNGDGRLYSDETIDRFMGALRLSPEFYYQVPGAMEGVNWTQGLCYRLGLSLPFTVAANLQNRDRESGRADYYEVSTEEVANNEDKTNARSVSLGLEAGAQAGYAVSDGHVLWLGVLAGAGLGSGNSSMTDEKGQMLPGALLTGGTNYFGGNLGLSWVDRSIGNLSHLEIQPELTGYWGRQAVDSPYREERVPTRALFLELEMAMPLSESPLPTPLKTPVAETPPAADTDTDGDGISDDADVCDAHPEDIDGYKDEDGCPDYDNDRDGLGDEYDSCPDEAVTENDIDEDADGCPDEFTPINADPIEEEILGEEFLDEELPEVVVTENVPPERVTWDVQFMKADNTLSETWSVGYNKGDDFIDPDEDGLQNYQERLWFTDPNKPDTDQDGIYESQDVADPEDVDGDGFIEALDQDSDSDRTADGADGTDPYPNVRGRKDPKDKDQDPTGTLDFIQMTNVLDALSSEGEIALSNITFEVGSANLTDSAKGILNQIATQLNSPEGQKLTLIEIAGYASTEGAASNDVSPTLQNNNLTLSEKRAEAVFKYLVSQKVGSDRLFDNGYGESVPLYAVGQPCSDAPVTDLTTEQDGLCAEQGQTENKEITRRVVFRVKTRSDQ